MSRRPFPKALYRLNHSIGRSEAVVSLSAQLDPTLWSQRKKNIILRALRSGIVSCGRDTARFIADLVDTFCDESIPTLSYWHTCLESKYVKPERYEDLIAYTCAWIKLKRANHKPVNSYSRPLNWAEQRFLDIIEGHSTSGRYQRGSNPSEIPLPSHLTHKERGEFVQEYLVNPNDNAVKQREALAQMIERNEPITFVFHNH